MKPIYFSLLFSLLLLQPLNAAVATAALRVTCDGDDVGAEVYLNGKFKGECPVDIQIPEGKYKLKVIKEVDASHERIFEQDLRLAGGTAKKVEAVLTSRLTAAGQKLEDQRLVAERAEAARREAMERAAAAKREEELQRIRAQFHADIASGAIPASFRDGPDCPEMVAIPPGSFEMGSTDGAADEQPMHRVTIAQAFALGKTEVTRRQWRAVMGDVPSYFADCDGNGDCPVNVVSWDDTQEFIRKLNAQTGKQYRLPSEAEWEYACHGGNQTEYCGGNNLDAVGWNRGGPYPVGQKQANGYGLYDMTGNVEEWVADSYHDSYRGAPSDGSVWQGDGATRVLRGERGMDARAANRDRWPRPAERIGGHGFRLARTLP